MTKTREIFTSPVGRLVQGSPFEAQTKDQQGNPRVVKSGPNIGQPNPQFFVAVAYEKANPEWPAFEALLRRVAAVEWPTLFPGGPTGPCVNPLFTFKIKDGDGVDRQGKSNATKEGFAGHWIVSFASSYAPKVVRPSGPNVWETVTDPKFIKRGDYVRIAGSATGNDSPQTPGIYVNLDMVEFVGHGVEIVSGPDAASAFGAAAGYVPAGVSTTPVASAATPAIPGAPAAKVMLPAANGVTYEAYIAGGWTDAQLIAAGYLVPPAAAPVTPPPPPAAATVPPPPAAATVPPTQPYAGYMGAGAGQPVTGAAPPPPPGSAPLVTASPTRVMLPAAGTATYESFVASGWTDTQMIAAGYLAPPAAA